MSIKYWMFLLILKIQVHVQYFEQEFHSADMIRNCYSYPASSTIFTSLSKPKEEISL